MASPQVDTSNNATQNQSDSSQTAVTPQMMAVLQTLMQSSQAQGQQQSQPQTQQFGGGQTGGQGVTGTWNPNTGLHDNQNKVLQSVIDQQTKKHALDFVNTYGTKTAQQVADTHTATSPSNQQQPPMSTPNGINQSGAQLLNSILPQQSQGNTASQIDPLIQAAQQGKTSLPNQQINNPQGPANVQTGQVETDKTKGGLFNRGQVYRDANGVIHIQPGSGAFGGQKHLAMMLSNVKAMQDITGSNPIQPENSIAYKVEEAKQEAEKTPMNQAQKNQYNLALQTTALDVANKQVDQFNTQSAPVISNLQKIDSLLPLEQAAVNGDRTAQSSIVAGAKEIYGQAGNILGQGVVGKMATYLGGKYDAKSVQALVENIKSVRQSMIKKLAATEKSSSSRIGNLKIGDKTIYSSDLLSHPYSAETSPMVNNFSSENDANKAASSGQLKDGAIVSIGGKQFKWSNQ